jgi:uncharacterized metal-binding protein
VCIYRKKVLPQVMSCELPSIEASRHAGLFLPIVLQIKKAHVGISGTGRLFLNMLWIGPTLDGRSHSKRRWGKLVFEKPVKESYLWGRPRVSFDFCFFVGRMLTLRNQARSQASLIRFSIGETPY